MIDPWSPADCAHARGAHVYFGLCVHTSCRHLAYARLVCAPYESDAQLLSLQRQGYIDKLLSEDSDISHIGAKSGTVLSRYIVWQAAGHRHARFQPDTPTVRRCVRAALLDTDYSLNKPLVRDWSEVDATAERILLELGGRERRWLEPFTSARIDVQPGDVLAALVSLKLSEDLIHRSLSRLNLQVANDQRRKAIRYVKGGHMDLNSLHLTRVEKDGQLLLLCHVSVAASRRAKVYRVRVCLRVNAAGEAVEWLPPPFSQCGCIIHQYVCAHSMAVLCLVAFMAATAVRLSVDGKMPSLEDLKRHAPEPVLGLAQMPILLRQKDFERSTCLSF